MDIASEKSLKPYIGLDKFLVFVYLSACVSCNSGRIKLINDAKLKHTNLKFCTNVYVLCEVCFKVFDVHCQVERNIQGHIKLPQYITACGRNFFKISFNIVAVHEIMKSICVTWMLSRIFCL